MASLPCAPHLQISTSRRPRTPGRCRCLKSFAPQLCPVQTVVISSIAVDEHITLPSPCQTLSRPCQTTFSRVSLPQNKLMFLFGCLHSYIGCSEPPPPQHQPTPTQPNPSLREPQNIRRGVSAWNTPQRPLCFSLSRPAFRLPLSSVSGFRLSSRKQMKWPQPGNPRGRLELGSPSRGQWRCKSSYFRSHTLQCLSGPAQRAKSRELLTNHQSVNRAVL